MTTKLDQLMRRQEVGAISPAKAAKLFTGLDNSRSGFYAKCWLRHLELVAERRYRRAKR